MLVPIYIEDSAKAEENHISLKNKDSDMSHVIDYVNEIIKKNRELKEKAK